MIRKNIYIQLVLILSLFLVLSACSQTENSDKENEAEADTNTETRTITHLGEEVTIPKKAENIVIVGAMEAFEDALLLDVHPVGASTIGGEFPEVFSEITDQATPIGEKTEPNLDKIIELKPDVILVSTKFPDETKEKLKKLAPIVEISHISSDGIENLETLAEIVGKKDRAAEVIAEYEEKLDQAKERIAENKDKKVLALRIRGGELNVYPEDVFFNLMIYEKLGLTPPAVIESAQAQEVISLEKLAEEDPDIIFVQNIEAADESDALVDVADNPIWESLTAVNENQVHVNVVDPILEGGPLYSRIQLTEALAEHIGH